MPVVPQYFQKADSAVSRVDQTTTTAPLPIRKHHFDTPRLRVHLNDLGHEGSSIFLSNVKGNEDIEAQVQNVLNLLYEPEDKRPGTRSVTLVLRQAEGVAYTTGIDLDHDHKEIHFNLNYITAVQASRHELLGVICHELVHCFQYNAHGTCPGGLIEGIADYVRLRAGLGATHWRQEASGSWDAGYQHTGYFLDYLEKRFGDGTVKAINRGLRDDKYDEKKLFKECCGGNKVEKLWGDYKEDLEKENGKDQSGEQPPTPIPTHGPRKP